MSEELISSLVASVLINIPMLIMAYFDWNNYILLGYSFLFTTTMIFVFSKYPMVLTQPDKVFNTLFPK